jgi:phosphatidylcholine synthase
MGLVLAAGIAVLLVRGGPAAFGWSFILMAIATLVDATDGTMARRVDVKHVLPNFDGRRLDDITDFLTYTFLPLLLIWRAELLPAGYEPLLLLPLLASAYGFCQVDIKTDDGYFLGFPSLWNVVAFYLYALQLPPFAALGIVVVLALMTFVPSRYLYATQPGRLNYISNVISVPWVLMLAWLFWEIPRDSAPETTGFYYTMALVSMYYPVYYMGASWTVTTRKWLAGRPDDSGPAA